MSCEGFSEVVSPHGTQNLDGAKALAQNATFASENGSLISAPKPLDGDALLVGELFVRGGRY